MVKSIIINQIFCFIKGYKGDRQSNTEEKTNPSYSSLHLVARALVVELYTQPTCFSGFEKPHYPQLATKSRPPTYVSST